MSDLRIVVFNGSYNNEDAYSKVLGYISNKTYFGSYGFNFSSHLPITGQFQINEIYSAHCQNPDRQKIWHFILTFADRLKDTELLALADQTALLFSAEYQVMYGLDKEKGNLHLHFGVNAFSFYPDNPVLSPERMHGMMKHLQNFLSVRYPAKKVTLQFQGKKG